MNITLQSRFWRISPAVGSPCSPSFAPTFTTTAGFPPNIWATGTAASDGGRGKRQRFARLTVRRIYHKLNRVVDALTHAPSRVVVVGKILETLLAKLTENELRDFLQVAPTIPAAALTTARLFSDRYRLLGSLPQGGVVAEVETLTGDFAQHILNVCKPAKLHLVDIDLSRFKRSAHKHNINSGLIELHRGDSSSILQSFPDRSFDVIYIDADHSYAGVKKDLDAALAKIKPEGYIVCNDYTNWSAIEAAPYGVMRAVNEAIIEHDLIVTGFGFNEWGYHDIALARTFYKSF